MAWAFVQTKQNSTGSGTSFTISPTSAISAGDLVVVNVKFGNNPGGAPTVTDNASTPNTYAEAGGTNNGLTYEYQYYGVAVTGGATSITVSWTSSTAASGTVDEYSGGASTNATVFDKAATNTGASTASSVTLSPTSSGELIAVGVALTSATSIAAGSGYTLATSQTNQSTEYKLSGTTSETAPMTFSGNSWAEVAGAYIPSSATHSSSLTASLSFSGAQPKQTSTPQTANLSFSGSISRLIGYVTAASMSFSGAFSKLSQLPQSAALTFSGGFSPPLLTKVLSAAVSFVGSSPHRISRAVGAALTFTGSIPYHALTPVSFTAAISFTGSTVRQARKGLTASVSFSGGVGRSIARTLAAILNFSPTADSHAGGMGEADFGDSYFGQGAAESTGGIGNLIITYIKSKGLSFIGALFTKFMPPLRAPIYLDSVDNAILTLDSEQDIITLDSKEDIINLS